MKVYTHTHACEIACVTLYVFMKITAAYKGVDVVIEKDLRSCSQVSLSIAALRNQLNLFGQNSLSINRKVKDIFYSTPYYSCYTAGIIMMCYFFLNQTNTKNSVQNITIQGGNCLLLPSRCWASSVL